MKLNKITIVNYRSIEKVEFPLEPINGSSTYCLLGINESGKSSFLKALALYDNVSIKYPQDFLDDSRDVEIIFEYFLQEANLNILKNHLEEEFQFPKELTSNIEVEQVKITRKFKADPACTHTTIETVIFKTTVFNDFTLKVEMPTLKENLDTTEESFDIVDFFEKYLNKYFWKYSHTVIFWKSSSQYLIDEEIDLNEFSAKPKEVSIPLFNCFKLVGITEDKITKEVEKLNNPVSIQNLQDKLSDTVTNHINTVWPEHEILIKFLINNNKLSFLVEDKGVRYKSKTTSQRSDGFRQFISFLLTLSVENLNQELSKKILLLDEPETHLHPQAQINLKEELIKITKNSKNNIVFFATHSNYMIDKVNIERCYKVRKVKNQITTLSKVNKTNSSYSEVNYDVFEIATNDYHNELYGFLEDTAKDNLYNLPQDRKWINELSTKTENVSLAKYIRNSIHHPENTSNKPFTDKELRKSIEIMKGIKSSNP